MTAGAEVVGDVVGVVVEGVEVVSGNELGVFAILDSYHINIFQYLHCNI